MVCDSRVRMPGAKTATERAEITTVAAVVDTTVAVVPETTARGFPKIISFFERFPFGKIIVGAICRHVNGMVQLGMAHIPLG